MVRSDVRFKRQLKGATNVVGKGVLLGLFVSASALTQASPVSISLGDNCSNSSGQQSSASSRHGSNSGGCSIILNEQFSESSGSAGVVQTSFNIPATNSVQTSFITPAPGSPIGGAPLASAKAAVAVPAAVISAPIAVLPQAVTPQQIVAAAPLPQVVTPVVVAAPTGDNNALPAPSVSVFAVPEPSTAVLLLGGFLALIGVRRSRANKK